MASSRVSVVVVSYNTREKLRRCLLAIEPEHEVIVIDNASSDGSADMVASDFPHVKLIRNRVNRGFGGANNQGIDASSRELVLFLNSDAYAFRGAIDRLAQEFVSRDIVGAGGQLLNPDGSRQLSSANKLTLWALFCEQTLLEKLDPHSRFFSPYWNSDKVGDTTTPVDQVMGACLMIRPRERFDERFFLYVEDTELCYRLRRHGKILYVPAAKFTHELGSSSADSRWVAVARYNRGKELFFRLHSGPFTMATAWLMNRMGALLRLLIWTGATFGTMGKRAEFKQKAVTFWRVLTAPFSGPRRPA
ncbi:MAG: N-acetylglucosaminyl-diphospho-decaprenol L-rhamnosyltransferase [Fimbriimonadaceae bacterium]|jgi:GT2 family glycosyltransferase|nr:N-acetylglucosaminyl-diphospho-decaprenol L-rhamnosyltransferase [Fimbriimonadaceae bacterium]